MLGDYFTTSSAKQSDQATNAGYTPNQNLCEEDFVLLEDGTKTLENGNTESQATSQKSIDSRFQRSALSESENEWVLVDDQDQQECCISNHSKSKPSKQTLSDDWVIFSASSSSAPITNNSKCSSSSLFNSQTNGKFKKYHQLPEGWVVVDKFYA